MGRQVPAGSLVRAQADFFSSPNVREAGLLASDMALSLFYNNSPQAWTLLDGAAVPDASASAGSVYFNEVPGKPGFYSVRLFPDKAGYWRVVLMCAVAESSFEFDLGPAVSAAPGLMASFTG